GGVVNVAADRGRSVTRTRLRFASGELAAVLIALQVFAIEATCRGVARVDAAPRADRAAHAAAPAGAGRASRGTAAAAARAGSAAARGFASSVVARSTTGADNADKTNPYQAGQRVA